ncbi:hypothetical protein [Arthrobacter sp. NPDC090010]|uniref:hypothetical protein n=1 Tax=Arthrobacter sp. NPDC090010 TaxID=3363942 RepID=UPI003810038D
MSKTIFKRSLAVAAVPLFALTLGACGGTQSAADACAKLDSDMSGVATELQSNMSKFATDPKAAAEGLSKFSDKFKESVKGVTNPDVKSKAEAASTAYADFTAKIKSASEDPATAATKLTDLSGASTKVQESFTELGKVCKK